MTSSRLFWYSTITIAWLLIIALFLYSSYVPRWLSSRERSISVFFWADAIPQKMIATFEKETGIKVYVNYYEENDELFAKLQFSRGAGYDLLMPSNYMVQPLVQAGFLKKIDKSRLNFLPEIDQRLLGLDFDPDNSYSLPYAWDVYGLGVDTHFLEGKDFQASWRMLFDRPYPYLVGMTDEPREVITVASQYLFGHAQPLTPQEAREVERLLVKQKKFVEAYTDLAIDTLLASKTCPVVLGASAYIARARKRTPSVQLVLPTEGSIMAIENFTIAARSTKDDLVYQFLNFMYQQRVFNEIYQTYGCLPSLHAMLRTIDLSHIANASLLFTDYFKRITLARALLPRDQMIKLWLAIKAY